MLNWWAEDSPVKDKFMCIADGSVRSGKTVACLLSFMMYTMTNFEQQNFAIAGKSVGAVRRNLIIPLKSMLISLGYECIEHRSENYLEIIYKDNTNYYYLFGLKDETAADHIQGFTLASAFIDS